jgi:hypothetical protein
MADFETTEPAMRGKMAITISLAEAERGIDAVALHDGMPPGLSPEDNENGWRMSLGKVADPTSLRNRR